MTQILADSQVKNLIGKVILNTDQSYLNPNGIELRLGNSVKFHSTDEVASIHPGDYLKVGPGQSVTICSHEKIDFSSSTLNEIYPGKQLMGLITPTTTMMREGISQITTKIDSGYCGYLNWSLRNNTYKDILIEQGEPIYKLTLLLLDGEHDIPELLYGDRDDDQYQGGEGIQGSTRRIKADIQNVVEPSQPDPKISLEEAGFPFNQIAKELTEFDKKLESASSQFRESVYKSGVAIVSAGVMLYGGLGVLEGWGLGDGSISLIALTIGLLGLSSILILWKKKG